MSAPRPESVTRLTDIVVDKVLSRLATSGSSLADDFVTRVNQALGSPVEITPNTPASSVLNVGVSTYTLPSGARIGIYGDSSLLALSVGTIDFASGTISTGSNASFSLPNPAAGQYLRALIHFSKDLLALSVTFGTPDASLAAAGYPPALAGYSPLVLLELHSTAGGIGSFDAIAAGNIIYLVGSLSSAKGPVLEQQTVSGSPQTLFTLTTIVAPANRLKLKVSVNGVEQFYPEDFSVPSNTTVSFTNAQPINAEVSFEVLN